MRKIFLSSVLLWMIPMVVNASTLNQEEFEYTNISEWHEKGYTGEDVKIVISDQGNVYAEHPAFDGKVFVLDEHLKSNSITFSHAEDVIHVIRQVAPDAEIYVSSMWANSSIKSALELDAQIVTRSQSYDDLFLNLDTELSKQAYDSGIFLNGSAGNYSTISNAYLRSSYWWSTGAVSMENGLPLRTNYSSYGEGLKSVSFTSLLICQALKPCDKPWITGSYFHGTSAATSFLSGIVALYYQYYKEQNGHFPSVEETRQFIIDSSIDLEDTGYDNYTGHGLFVLPKLDELNNDKCKITPEESNQFAVKMMNPDGEIRYVHTGYVDEYRAKGYKLPGCGGVD